MIMLKRNIYTDPAGWAEMVVGTRRRYAAVSALSALAGAAIIILAGIEEGEWGVTVCSILLIFIFAVELPLYYLRALRRLVTERRQLRRMQEA